MKKNLLLIIIIFFQNLNLFSQSYIYYGDKTFGGNLYEYFTTIQKADSSHFIISGSSSTNVNGDKTDPLCDSITFGNLNRYDNWILKVDTALNIVWDRDIGKTPISDIGGSRPFLIMTGNNGEMIFTSSTWGDSACEKSENKRDSVAVLNRIILDPLSTLFPPNVLSHNLLPLASNAHTQ